MSISGRARRRAIAAGAITMALFGNAGAVRAEGLFSGADLFSAQRFSGHADLRLGLANGEPSWLDEGFGKSRFGSNNDGVDARVTLAEASLAWEPIFAWPIEGYVHAQYTGEQKTEIDLVEAFATFRAPPMQAGRFKMRGGLFYPPVSLEHQHNAWRTIYSITPSAINTWIGEEVKVVGVEASFERSFGAHKFAATGSVFGYNDTSGTLLSWRGWALHDLKTTMFSDQALPDRPFGLFPTVFFFQAPRTEPFREVDGIIGYYARADWRAPDVVALNIVRYNNRGDGTSAEEGQISWETYFTNIGLTLDLSENTIALAQGMYGRTYFGRSDPPIVDVKYAAAYALINHSWGPHSLTGRFDWFETTDQTFVALDNNNERGWALLAAYGYEINKNNTLMAEIMRISSDRPTRAEAAIDPTQVQLVFQLNWRIGF